LKVWDFNTAVKRVEFNEDGSQLLAVTEKRMGFLGTIVVLDINRDPEAEQSDERALVITCEDSRATVAGWSYLSKYIIAGHEDGSVSQYDAKVSTILMGKRCVKLSCRLESNSLMLMFTRQTCQSWISSGRPIGRTSLPHQKTSMPK
jgi:hypothetical protein